MKLSLPANISKLRKEHSMTQEQLAEALGVTFASVSKWERGVATPELNLIAEMADLFEVSIDALIGYEFRNNDRENVIARLKQYCHDRNNKDAFADVEKALQRYPNCFGVIYYSARFYSLSGLTQKNGAYSKRALSLYNRACMLIKQNEDPEISDISIRKEMAEIHLALGEYANAVFADKADISEELARLDSHFAQFRSMLREDVPVGRKLDFLVQEINRECNTIGSKSSDTEFAKLVIEAKSTVEKIREQIQNIE